MKHARKLRLTSLCLCLCLLLAGAAPVYGLSEDDALTLTFDHIAAHVQPPQAVNGFTDAQVIQYFVEVAMYSEYEGYRGYLMRYEQPRKYCFLGSPDEEDKAQVRALVAELNQIVGCPDLTETANVNEADIKIMFSDQASYENYFSLRVPAGSWGYASVWYYDQGYYLGELTATHIWISTDAWPRRDRNSVIAEEFIQGLGLLNDPEYGYYSIFDQNRNDCDWPSELDWAVVNLLYHPWMDRTASESQVRETAQMILDSWK